MFPEKRGFYYMFAKGMVNSQKLSLLTSEKFLSLLTPKVFLSLFV